MWDFCEKWKVLFVLYNSITCSPDTSNKYMYLLVQVILYGEISRTICLQNTHLKLLVYIFMMLQNKVLIYRGKEYERLQDFNARMQILFPNAEVRWRIFRFFLLLINFHRVRSLHRKRGRNSGLGVFSRRIAVVFACFAAILKKIFVGELRKSFFKNKKRLCASVKSSSSGSTHISLITECFADA